MSTLQLETTPGRAPGAARPATDEAAGRGEWLNSLAALAIGSLAAFLVLGAVALPWWSVPAYTAPKYFLAFRAAAAVCLVVLLFAAARRRPALLMTTGIALVLLPLSLVLTVMTLDRASLGTAVEVNRSADRLVGQITHSDINSRTAWTEDRAFTANVVDSDDYTMVESYEIVMFFVKGGWYCAILSGGLLVLAACVSDRRQAHGAFRRACVGLAAAAVVVGPVTFGPILAGYYFWNKGRAANAAADYSTALDDYRRAARWDGRLNYDLNYHYEMGTLDGRLGLTGEPDYWTAVAAGYVRSGQDQLAYATVKSHIPDPTVNPCVRWNYAHILVRRGAADYRNLMPGSALLKWRQALALDPNDLEAEFALAQADTKLRRYAEAVDVWRDLIRQVNGINLYSHSFFQDRTYVPVIRGRSWAMLSWCYFQLGRYPDSMEANADSMGQGPNVLTTVSVGDGAGGGLTADAARQWTSAHP